MDAEKSAHTDLHLHGWVEWGLFEFGQSRGHRPRHCLKYTHVRHTKGIVHSNKLDKTNGHTETHMLPHSYK